MMPRGSWLFAARDASGGACRIPSQGRLGDVIPVRLVLGDRGFGLFQLHAFGVVEALRSMRTTP